MGLDTSHDCWSGPYSQFMRWRVWLASQVGIPLNLMRGFYDWEWDDSDLDFDRDYSEIVGLRGQRGNMWWDTLRAFRDLGRPISWELMNGDPVVKLLHHSDCDGRIRWFDCKPLAIRLGQILRVAGDDTREALYSDGPNAGTPIWTHWRDGRGCYDGMVPATKRFIRGLLKAYHSREDVRFR